MGEDTAPSLSNPLKRQGSHQIVYRNVKQENATSCSSIRLSESRIIKHFVAPAQALQKAFIGVVGLSIGKS